MSERVRVKAMGGSDNSTLRTLFSVRSPHPRQAGGCGCIQFILNIGVINPGMEFLFPRQLVEILESSVELSPNVNLWVDSSSDRWGSSSSLSL